MATSIRPKCAIDPATAASTAALSSTFSGKASTWSPYWSTRGLSVLTSRAVATTLSPRARAASAQMRPNPFEVPVMNHTLFVIQSLLKTAPIGGSRVAAPRLQRWGAKIEVLDLLGYSRPIAQLPSPTLGTTPGQAQRRIDPCAQLTTDIRRLRKRWPFRYGVPDLFDDGPRARGVQGGRLRARLKVLERKPVVLAVERHLVSARPLAIQGEVPGDVEGWRQVPGPATVHQEGDVLDVVVLVAGDDVERHPPILFLHRLGSEAQLADHQHRLLVGIGLGVVEIEMGQGRQRLHVQLSAALQAVEALGHEVPPAVLLQKVGVGHLDARGGRHLRVGVLHRAVAFGVDQLLVLVARHSVELQEPVAVALAGRDLAGAHIVGLAVPGDHRLRSEERRV